MRGSFASGGSKAWMVAVGVLGAATASAAPEAPPAAETPKAPPDEPAALPTSVVYAAPIAFPPGEVGVSEQLPAQVEVETDGEGRVYTSRILTSTGRPGVDAAILASMAAWRFRPVIDEYGYESAAVFVWPVVVDGARVPEPALEGAITEAGTRTRIAGIEVRATDASGNRAYAVTDAEGRYTFYDLTPGEWTVSAGGRGGLAEEVTPVALKAGVVVGVPLFVKRDRPWESEENIETIEVIGKLDKPEITERVLTRDQIRYLPGTSGDVVRAVQNFPGVARPPLNIGQLIIRGTAPEDSVYYIDGVRIPIAFHFAGLSTVVNGDFLQGVNFLPGNYGVRYGRAIGGAVDLQTTDVLPENNEGYVQVDLYQATAFVNQRVGENTAISFSGRRSYIDAVLTPVLSNSMNSVRAPSYFDLQARIVHHSEKWGNFDALIFGSDDRFRVVGGETEDDGDEQVRIALITSFAKGRLGWKKSLPDRWKSEMSVIVGPDNNEFEIAPEGESYERNFVIGLREEITRSAGDGAPVSWRIGYDGQVNRFGFLYDVPNFGKREEASGWWFTPGFYVEPTLEIGEMRVTLGGRVDGLILRDDAQIWTFDPRLSVVAPFASAWKLKGSLGQYSQFPIPRELIPESDGNADLGSVFSNQASIGVEVDPGTGLTGEVNAFYAALDQLVVGREDRFRFFTGPPPFGPFDTDPYGQEGEGTIYGVEALGRYNGERLTAWLAATWSRSLRQSRIDDEPRLFTYDQPFVINAIASYQLPKGWRIGGRVRFGSGNPYTPVVNRYYDLDSRQFFPVYGETDSARLPPFTSLDVRFDKEWTYDRWKLAFYLDIQNATNAQNPEVMSWTYDYSEEDPVTSTPALPVFGFRGSF